MSPAKCTYLRNTTYYSVHSFMLFHYFHLPCTYSMKHRSFFPERLNMTVEGEGGREKGKKCDTEYVCYCTQQNQSVLVLFRLYSEWKPVLLKKKVKSLKLKQTATFLIPSKPYISLLSSIIYNFQVSFLLFNSYWHVSFLNCCFHEFWNVYRVYMGWPGPHTVELRRGDFILNIQFPTFEGTVII